MGPLRHGAVLLVPFKQILGVILPPQTYPAGDKCNAHINWKAQYPLIPGLQIDRAQCQEGPGGESVAPTI